MTTDRRYAGKVDHARNPEQTALNSPQTAQNTAQTPLSPDDWREDFLLEVGQDNHSKTSLFALLEVVRKQAESDSPVPILTYFLKCFVDDRYARLEAKENRQKLHQLTDLINFFLSLDERYVKFCNETDYDSWVDEKEVCNG